MNITAKLQCLEDLKSKHEEVQREAVQQLSTAVEEVGSGSNLETFNKFVEQITATFGQIVNSKSSHAFAGFISAMDALIGNENEELHPHVHKWLPYLKVVITKPACDEAVREMAVRTVGRVCALRIDVIDFVQNMFDFSVEELSVGGREAKLRIAVLLLGELAVNASVFVGTRLEAFKAAMWAAVVSEYPAIRIASKDAVGAFLALASERTQHRKRWQREIFDGALESLSLRPKEVRALFTAAACECWLVRWRVFMAACCAPSSWRFTAQPR